MAVAIIVAAGRGERLGFAEPKALVALAGRSLLDRSLDLARTVAEHVVVALPGGVPAPAGTTGATGGATRSHSVRNALAVAPPGDRVVVHDAARPFASAELFARVLAALDDADAAIAAVRVSDTLKEDDGAGMVRRTVDRSALWAVQTPQAFRRETLARALDAPDDVLAQATDDAWLVERAGGRVALVESSSENLKVTTRADLRLAEALLAG